MKQKSTKPQLVLLLLTMVYATIGAAWQSGISVEPPEHPVQLAATQQPLSPVSETDSRRASSNKGAPLTARAPNSTTVSDSSSIAAKPSPEPTPRGPMTDDPSHLSISYHALGAISTLSAALPSSTPWYAGFTQAPTRPDANGAGHTVAVIDTGFALNHIGLSGSWAVNSREVGPTTIEGPAPNCSSRGLPLDKSCNNLDNDGNGYPSDWRGWDFVAGDNSPLAGTFNLASTIAFHGTFVAGLIAAANQSGISGIARGAKVLPLQALDDNGDGTTDTIAEAVRYAADMHVDVISLSLGSDSDDPYLDAQIDYALSKGIAVVAAAGNGGCDCMVYPAALPEVVGVGASDQSDLRASFSSYGSSLDLLAPGTAMCSTLWSAANQTSGYGCGGQGTSFATPLVSGAIVAALTAGAASTDLAIQSVMASADKVSSMASNSRTDLYGVGRLDLSEALTAAASKHYSISADLAMRFHCPGDVHTCSYAIGDQFGATVVISAKAPVTAGGEYVYLLPNGDNTTPGIKSLQPFGSAIHQPRIYVTFDP